MSLSKRQIAYLNKIIATAQKMLDTAHLEESRSGGGQKRHRRSAVEAEKMRADILAEIGRIDHLGEMGVALDPAMHAVRHPSE